MEEYAFLGKFAGIFSPRPPLAAKKNQFQMKAHLDPSAQPEMLWHFVFGFAHNGNASIRSTTTS
jgi:hypothetical protein